MQPQTEQALVRVADAQLVSARESVYMPAMSMEVALARREAVVQFTGRIMVKDTDFGTIPGTPKPTLLKPGAEKLVNFFGLEPVYETVTEDLDWTGERHAGEPLYYIRYRCRLMKDGRLFGSGEGSANSWEAKYRYRWVSEDAVPIGLNIANLKSRGGKTSKFEPDFALNKKETTGKYGKPAEYWQAFETAISNSTARRVRGKKMGTKTFDGWEMDVDEKQYRISNPEFADLINTCQKMAQKRALVAATLIATSASEFFTQDMEDLPGSATAAAPTSGPFPDESGTEAPTDPGPMLDDAPQSVAPPAPRPAEAWPGQTRFLEDCRIEYKRLGKSAFMSVLGAYGFTTPGEVPDKKTARKIYDELFEKADPEKPAAAPKGQITNAHGTTVDDSDVPFGPE